MADTIDKEQLSIVGSLFGVSPQQLQMVREQQAYTQGTQAGNNLLGGILGQSGMFAERAGAGLRGALGVQTPEEQLAGLRQQAQQQFDTRTPEGLVQMAQFLNQQGDAAGAQQAIMLAQQRASTAQGIATSRAQQIRAEREPGQVNFQQLLSSGKYTPASIAKFRDSQNPADLVLVKGPAEGKELTPAQVEAKQADAQIAVDTVQEAKDLTSEWSTGYGAWLAALPKSDARKLQGKLDTIKSNLAAAMIEDLKSQSKTGATGLGALNREELKVLQTSKASLDAGMGADELNKSLNVIDKYFKARAGTPTTAKPTTDNDPLGLRGKK